MLDIRFDEQTGPDLSVRGEKRDVSVQRDAWEAGTRAAV
jgi:hypothetical protein